MKRFRYQESLDGLRAFSILAVIGSHLQFPLMTGGFIGVDIFFVISGFLITILLLQERSDIGRIDLRRFYVRRALRLLPALFACLCFWLIYTTAFASQASPQNAILPVTFYYSNWYTIAHRDGSLGIFGHAWSLSVEEQFYLLWPVILIFATRLKPKALAVCLILGIAATAINRALLWKGGVPYERTYYGFDTRADSLLVGCLFAVCLFYDLIPESKWLRRTSALLGVIVVISLGITASLKSPILYLGGFTLVALSAASLIWELMVNPLFALEFVFKSRPMVWIGKLSYSLYLWHVPVYMVLGSIPGRFLFGFAIKTTVSFALAACSYYLIEKPSLRLKHRFEPSPLPPAIMPRPSNLVTFGKQRATAMRRRQQGAV